MKTIFSYAPQNELTLYVNFVKRFDIVNEFEKDKQ